MASEIVTGRPSGNTYQLINEFASLVFPYTAMHRGCSEFFEKKSWEDESTLPGHKPAFQKPTPETRIAALDLRASPSLPRRASPRVRARNRGSHRAPTRWP